MVKRCLEKKGSAIQERSTLVERLEHNAASKGKASYTTQIDESGACGPSLPAEGYPRYVLPHREAMHWIARSDQQQGALMNSHTRMYKRATRGSRSPDSTQDNSSNDNVSLSKGGDSSVQKREPERSPTRLPRTNEHASAERARRGPPQLLCDSRR
jgi:hypothetical protein